MILSEKHIFSTTEKDIIEIAKPLLEPVDITFFDHARIYNNGENYFLSSKKEIVHYIFEQQIQTIATPPPHLLEKENFCYLLRSEGSYSKVMQDIQNYFNIAHCINIIHRNTGYFDVYCFGTTPDNYKIVDFYLNNWDFFEKFILYFTEKAKKILKRCEDNKILLPLHMRPRFKGLEKNINETNTENIDISSKIPLVKFRLTGKYQHVIFSKRQTDCLKHLIFGCSSKEIAAVLNLSPRTVEFYLENIKTKLNCNRKSEIISILLKYGKHCLPKIS